MEQFKFFFYKFEFLNKPILPNLRFKIKVDSITFSYDIVESNEKKLRFQNRVKLVFTSFKYRSSLIKGTYEKSYFSILIYLDFFLSN